MLIHLKNKWFLTKSKRKKAHVSNKNKSSLPVFLKWTLKKEKLKVYIKKLIPFEKNGLSQKQFKNLLQQVCFIFLHSSVFYFFDNIQSYFTEPSLKYWGKKTKAKPKGIYYTWEKGLATVQQKRFFLYARYSSSTLNPP